MKRMTAIAMSLVLASLLSHVPQSVNAEVTTTPRRSVREPSPIRTVRLVLRDGTSRLVRFEGVGCSQSICSRVTVRSRPVAEGVVGRTPFDTLASVRDISQDETLFVLKNGSTKRVSIPWDNRVLYVVNADGLQEKIELGQVKSLDFVRSNQR
jgi:hypothetical protein